MSQSLITTLIDGYDNIYFPRSYANGVYRQSINETVEASLARLEAHNVIPYITSNHINRIVCFDAQDNTFKQTNATVSLEDGLTLIKNNNVIISSDGLITAKNLTLSNLTNTVGDFITISASGELQFRSFNLVLDDLGGAPIDSPIFTGIPKAPTPDFETNNEELATTAFVQDHVTVLEDKIDLYHHEWGHIRINKDNWSTEKDEFNYYFQRIEMEGMRPVYSPTAVLIVTNTRLEASEKEGFYNLGGISSYDGYIIVRTQTKPSVDLYLKIKGI